MSHNILIIKPFTRVNDNFVDNTSLINAQPVNKNVYHPLITGYPNCRETRVKAEFYSNIGCDVVSETVFNYPHPFLSEKTFRPILCKRMFIVLGSPNTLSLLHSNGFNTFNDFIDEKYDKILDPIKRFNAVVEEVHKLCDRPTKEIVDYLIHIEPRLIQNHNTLKDLQNKEIKDLKKRLYIDD